MRLSEPAPAKINLFLHVGALGADGYHPLSSLVAFADIGDVVTVEPADRLSLAVIGPFAGALDGQIDNLVLRALRALGQTIGTGEPRLRITLDKRLPIAAGLGGGSSDAGAALRLARRALRLDIDDLGLEVVAGMVGADGPMCLRARAAWAERRGDRLTDEPALPPLHGVLANPGVPSSTAAVYRAFDERETTADRPPPPARWTPQAVAEWLTRQRNDLQTPAVALQPAIGLALTAMDAMPGLRLSRMSGSGATVFGLFDDAVAARAAAKHLVRNHGDWWIKPVILGGKAASAIQ